MKAFARSLVLVLCCALASCAHPAAQFPNPVCNAIPLPLNDVNATFVSPPKGATNVPATIGSVTFTVSFSGLHQGHFRLSPTNGAQTGAPIVDAAYQTDASGKATVAVPTLSSGVTYSGEVLNGAPCGTDYFGNLGTFTVQ